MNKLLRKDSWGAKVSLAALFGGLSFGTVAGFAQQKQVGDVATDFQLINVMTEEPVRLSDFEGSVVVLDFFSYW